MPLKIETFVQAQYGAVADSGLSNRHEGVARWRRPSATVPRNYSPSLPMRTWACHAGIPPPLPISGPEKSSWTWAAAAGWTCSSPRKNWPAGKAIGIDMTPQMIARAKRNAEAGIGGRAISNVEFHLASIDKLPLPDASVDVVISNCVINLAPDKQAVFREIARVLKPGGRLAVSDIALKQPLPPALAGDLMAYAGCIAGAVLIDDYKRGLVEAGLTHVQIVESGSDLNAYAKVEGQSGCCSPPMASSERLPIVATGCCAAPDGTRRVDRSARTV